MKLDRRMFALAPLGLPLIGRAAAAQGGATAEATPVTLTAEQALEVLLTTPFQSPLLPADTGEVSIIEWNDPLDEDFSGTIGGVLVTTDPDDGDKTLGVIALFPDEAMAADRIQPLIPTAEYTKIEHRVEIAGATGLTSSVEAPSGLSEDVSYVFTLVHTSFAVVAGAASGDSIVGLEFRSIANLVATLDHFNQVVSPERA